MDLGQPMPHCLVRPTSHEVTKLTRRHTNPETSEFQLHGQGHSCEKITVDSLVMQDDSSWWESMLSEASVRLQLAGMVELVSKLPMKSFLTRAIWSLAWTELMPKGADSSNRKLNLWKKRGLGLTTVRLLNEKRSASTNTNQLSSQSSSDFFLSRKH